MERVDVAIVGGGPAGSAAAREAAARGADTVVFEKGVPRADRDGRPGSDATDAAGMLDYWVDIMDFAPEEIPDDVILATLDGAEFCGPSESVTIHTTGIDATYPEFGFAFHRARFDDWLRERAEDAGAQYRIGTGVNGVDSRRTGTDYTHELALKDGTTVEADHLILADGPQRTVTLDALDQFVPGTRTMRDHLGPNQANHIAYQEHRRMPEELFDPDLIRFWWGVMPGHTAYPWIFPNDDCVARIGLTMPMGMDLGDFPNRRAYALLRDEDERIPAGKAYVERLLEREFPGYDLADFPIVEDRGKQNGTEAYAISSTRPVESPVGADVAAVGGAMGATSAFHEGGDHVAVRTGKIAGRLAAEDRLGAYNDEWRGAIGDEVLRNVTMAEVVRGYEPPDWDRAFKTARAMTDRGRYGLAGAVRGGLDALRLFGEYQRTKFGFRGGRYAQFREDEYVC